MQGKDAAELLGWSPSKISRIETGRIGVAPPDLDRLLELYAATEQRADYIRRLAASARSRGWWDAYADKLSSGYANLIKLESGSRALQAYCAVVPHALLLTPRYAERVIRLSLQRPSEAEIARRIEVTQRRQAVLTRTDGPLELAVVIDEAVFRRPIRTPDGAVDLDVYRQQLTRLVDAAGKPNVRMQVLPFETGLPPVTSGSFSILESAAANAPDVVYLENKTRIFFVETESEVYWYTQDFEMLSALALSTEESVKFIRNEISRL
jgi:hypothetical protein